MEQPNPPELKCPLCSVAATKLSADREHAGRYGVSRVNAAYVSEVLYQEGQP